MAGKRMVRSASVMNVAVSVGEEPVSVPELAGRLCNLHKDYFSGRFGEARDVLLKMASTETQRPAEAWLTEVESLFNDGTFNVLDTPTVAFGLALLDGDVFGVFHRLDLIDDLLGEIVVPEQGDDKLARRAATRGNPPGQGGEVRQKQSRLSQTPPEKTPPVKTRPVMK